MIKNGHLPLGPTDEYYRSLVPKDPVLNLEFRRTVLELCYSDRQARQEFALICSRDILFYINVCGWTLNPRLKPPLRPMITYGYQDKAILEIQESLGVCDLAVPKSRDMGASWCCLLVLEHAWHFEIMQQFLLTSEKEELVDGKSEKALFRKLDFWWRHLPGFLKPQSNRVKKHAKNTVTDSAFDGEATVQHMGTGDRRTAILLDEASKMENASAIRTATRDVSDCRIFNSTPNGRQGAGQAFYEQVRNPHCKKVFMHWSEHPDKQIGLYMLSPSGEKIPLDPETYNWRDDYDFDTLTFRANRRPQSPWYDKQCERANHNPIEIAQELDIDFVGSTQRLVSSETIAYVRDSLVKRPLEVGELLVDPIDVTVQFTGQNLGPALLWCPLDVQGRPPHGQYAIGIDTSMGRAGQYSSESAISVWNRATREQVLEYTSRSTPPAEWCRVAVAVAKWFHDAFMVPENNGSINLTFMDELGEVGYWNVYQQTYQTLGYKKHRKTRGYHNNDRGQQILEKLCADMVRGHCKLRSERTLKQLLEYEIRAGGKMVHAGSAASNATADQGKLHGDAAIAAALGYLGCIERPASEKTTTLSEPDIQPGSMAWRMQQLDRSSAGGGGDFVW